MQPLTRPLFIYLFFFPLVVNRSFIPSFYQQDICLGSYLHVANQINQLQLAEPAAC